MFVKLPALLGMIGTALIASSSLAAQQPLRLSAVLTAFLTDSGVATRGLPWTTGSSLPVKWETPKPVAAPYLKQDGFSLRRVGKCRVNVDGRRPVEASVDVLGNEVGIQRVSVSFDLAELELELAERSLAADGIQLSPLKCSRKTEGASYGNLVYVIKAPGKTATGLWEFWDCSATHCGGGFSILYRKTDVSKVDCASTQ